MNPGLTTTTNVSNKVYYGNLAITLRIIMFAKLSQ